MFVPNPVFQQDPYLSRPIENFCLGPICIALTVLLRFARFIPAPMSTRNTRSVVRVDKGIVSNLPVVMLTRVVSRGSSTLWFDVTSRVSSLSWTA